MTDKEKRIFLAAIERERKICETMDECFGIDDCIKLVPICDSILNKVKQSDLWKDEEEIPWN